MQENVFRATSGRVIISQKTQARNLKNPKPLIMFCYKCGKENQLEDHDCQPTCKICQEPHETAGKECRWKLKPNPPPYKIRLQWEKKLQEQQRRWNLSSDSEFPELPAPSNVLPSTEQASRKDSTPPGGEKARSKSRSRSRSRSRTPNLEK